MKSIVVYATDENYVKLTAVSIYSLLLHNPNAEIAILADDISTHYYPAYGIVVGILIASL